MYKMYLGTMLCPVTPSKIDVKIKGQNKTLTLINDVQVNVLKNPSLTEITFDLLLPNVKYPFANYNIVWKDAQWYLNRLEMLKSRKKVFQWIVTRSLPSGKLLYDTNMSVSLESYTIKEDVKNGFDVVVSVTLKQYREYGTKIVKVSAVEQKATVEKKRETTNSPAPTANSTKTHTVTEGDTLYNVSKTYYDDGSKHTEILEENKDKIENPNVLTPGMSLIIPVIASALTAKKSTKKTVTVLYMGIPQSGDYHLTYTLDGKINRKDFTNQLTITVDKGTEVTLIPKPTIETVTYDFVIEDNIKNVWEDANTKTPGKKAIVNDNVRITIQWGVKTSKYYNGKTELKG